MVLIYYLKFKRKEFSYSCENGFPVGQKNIYGDTSVYSKIHLIDTIFII